MKQRTFFLKLGSAIMLLLFVAAFTVPANAAVPMDVGKATTTVSVLPGCQVDQMIVEEVNGKMMAANQEKSLVDIMAAAEKGRNIEDLQAIMPPLISAEIAINKMGSDILNSVKSLNAWNNPSNLATMEVSNIGYVVTSANLMGWQFTGRNEKRVTEQLSLIPEVQVKRMINPTSGSAMVTSDLLKDMNQNCAATTKAANENDGQKNLQSPNLAAYRDVRSAKYFKVVEA